MRLAHASDFHLGRTQEVSSRRPKVVAQDAAESFTRCLDQIIAAKPDAVLLAGDLFHSPSPTYETRLFAFRELKRLRAALSCPIILIAGNHDTSKDCDAIHPFELMGEVDGVSCVFRGPQLFEYPALGLSLYAVPDAAIWSKTPLDLSVRGEQVKRVLMLHAPIGSVGQNDRSAHMVPQSALSPEWDYVALGDFHSTTKVKANAWYSGSTDFVSSDNWGEQRTEREQGIEGKAWLLVDLDTGSVERQGPTNRRVLVDLPPIQGLMKSATDIEAAIQSRIEEIGGVEGKIVRQVIHDIPREVEAALDKKLLHDLQMKAVHYRYDPRRPKYDLPVAVDPDDDGLFAFADEAEPKDGWAGRSDVPYEGEAFTADDLKILDQASLLLAVPPKAVAA